MSSTKRRPSFDEVVHPNIAFVGEQDGPSEGLLKQKLVDIFSGTQVVSRSYLARATVDDGQDVHVVLCLRAKEGAEEDLVAAIGTVFASIFNASEHLDIVFLADAEEEKLTRVCKPFFERPSGRSDGMQHATDKTARRADWAKILRLLRTRRG